MVNVQKGFSLPVFMLILAQIDFIATALIIVGHMKLSASIQTVWWNDPNIVITMGIEIIIITIMKNV